MGNGVIHPFQDTISYPAPQFTPLTMHIEGQSIPPDGHVIAQTTRGDPVIFSATNLGSDITLISVRLHLCG
jgi:hypothetical protein